MAAYHDPKRDGEIEALLRESMKTRAVDAGRAARVREAVHGEWSEVTRAQRRQRSSRWAIAGLATAAVALLALVLPRFGAQSQPRSPTDATPVATIRFTSGGVEGRLSDGTPTRWRAGDVLRTGDEVQTTGETASTGSLILDDGTEVRIRPLSRVVVEGPRRLGLRLGGVYVDTGRRVSGGPASAVAIVAAGSIVRDIGTRFMVQGGTTVAVGVRDGRVQLDQGGVVYEALPGEHLAVTASGAVTRSRRPTFGLDWDWIVRAAPPQPVDGRTLAEFLAWVEREGGRAVRFVDTALGTSAGATVVYGTIDGLTVEEALAVVLPTCGLTHRVDGAVITVVAADEPTSPR